MTELLFGMLGWWLIATMAGSLLTGLAYPLVRGWIGHLGPSLRSVVRLMYAATAPLAALLSVAIVSHPTIADLLVAAHCHGSQCTAHAPVYAANSSLLFAVSLIGSLIVLLLLATLLWTLRIGQRQLRVLSALAHRSVQGFHTLDSAEELVFCTGLLRPQILLSQGLVDRLQPDELAVVLAHEQAHAERLDNLRAFLLYWLTVFWPGSLRRRAQRDGRADAEQACDLAAARAFSGADQVVSVIRKLSQKSTAIPGGMFGRSVVLDSNDAVARVSVLEDGNKYDEATPGDWCKAFVSLTLGLGILIYVLSAASHQAIEWLGSFVV